MTFNNNETFYKLNINDVTIPYTLVKSSRRRSIAVCIDADGKMTVRSPYFVTNSMVERFLWEKKDWIYKHYLNILHTPAGVQENPLLVSKYKKYARKILESRVTYLQQFTGGQYTSITIRDQKTRWGSCSGRGTLSFNWRLILAPPEILDYVVVHELCHLTHMNHSKEFWALVESVIPDYKIKRKWLKENGHTLHL